MKAIEAMKSKQKAAAGASGRDSAADFVPSPESSRDPSSTGMGWGLWGGPAAVTPGAAATIWVGLGGVAGLG